MKCCAESPEPYFSETPHPYLHVTDPTTPVLPGQKLVGYMIHPSPKSMFVPPCERPMNIFGYMSVIALAFLFWPLSCLPCCCGFSYDGFQVPIYE